MKPTYRNGFVILSPDLLQVAPYFIIDENGQTNKTNGKSTRNNKNGSPEYRGNANKSKQDSNGQTTQ